VFRYSDGTREWGELRTAEEVFRAESLATLCDAPVTQDHPTEMVNPENFKALSIGHVASDVRRDGEFIAATCVIQDATNLGAIADGSAKDLSCGYSCDLEEVAGVSPEGEPYDRVQRNIQYNHVALLPPGAGRAGPNVSLRLDGAAVQVRVAKRVQRNDSMKTLKIRSKVYKIDSDEDLAETQKAMDAETAKADATESKYTALETALQQTMAELAKLKAAESTEESSEGEPMDASEEALDARIELRERARKVVGEKFTMKRADGKAKSNVEIQREIIGATAPTVKLDSLDAKSIPALYAAICGAQDAKSSTESKTDGDRNDAFANTARDIVGPANGGRKDSGVPAITERWKKPLMVNPSVQIR
jgi:hypothetical protein